jgi:hypothetical protein
MSRVDRWWADDPRRPPAEYAVELAGSRAWQQQTRFTKTSADVEDAAPLLRLEERFAHAFVVVLSQLPKSTRRRFAERFYAERTGERRGLSDAGSRGALALAASVALLVVGLSERADLADARLLDVLQGAAQGDDVSALPETTLEELRKAVARTRLDLDAENADNPAASAALVVAEVLDSSSHVVPLQEILVRAAWAAVKSWEPDRVLEFLLQVDELLSRYQPQELR